MLLTSWKWGLFYPYCNLFLCWQVGSLEGLYSLRDSRGRPDRAAFENRLASAAGVSVFKCSIKYLIKYPSHLRICRVNQAVAFQKKPLWGCFYFFWPDLHCLCNTAGNGFVTTTNQSVQLLRRDCLIHLTWPRQGEFTLWRRFWFYTACICKWQFIWLALLF